MLQCLRVGVECDFREPVVHLVLVGDCSDVCSVQVALLLVWLLSFFVGGTRAQQAVARGLHGFVADAFAMAGTVVVLCHLVRCELADLWSERQSKSFGRGEGSGLASRSDRVSETASRGEAEVAFILIREAATGWCTAST